MTNAASPAIAPQAQPVRGDFRFVHRLRVRWAEVDAQKVVFNGHYLTYLDVAISDYWRAVGLPYPDATVHLGVDLFVRHHDLDYHAPARLDDWLDIGVRCAKVGRSAITVNWAMWSAGRLLVTGNTVYVMTLLSDGRPTAVPDTVRAQLAAHEDGQSPYAWQLGGWSELGEGARAVRLPVFVDEQGVSADKELDDWDAVAVHGVLRNQAGLAVATGRLMLNVAEAHAAPHDAPALGHARLGRLAVLRSARGAGLGRRVLQSLLAHAWTQGVHTVHIHAQCTAQRLYAALGFQPVGPVFEEEGLAHQAMVLKRSA